MRDNCSSCTFLPHTSTQYTFIWQVYMNWNMPALELLVLVLIVCLFLINLVMRFNYSLLFIDNKCLSSLFTWHCWGIIMKIYTFNSYNREWKSLLKSWSRLMRFDVECCFLGWKFYIITLMVRIIQVLIQTLFSMINFDII